MRRAWRLAAALVAIAAAVVAGAAARARALRIPRPNMLLVLTDDQTLDTLPTDPPAMPWFQSQLLDPAGHWLWFPNAVASTPLCCPSRSTILTGQYDTHTGVRDNTQGRAARRHEHAAGLAARRPATTPGSSASTSTRTPGAGRRSSRPAGTDGSPRRTLNESTSYYDYDIVDQAIVAPLRRGAVDLRHRRARRTGGRLRAAGARRSAVVPLLQPERAAPAVDPAPAVRGGVRRMCSRRSRRSHVLNDVAGKPAYVRALPPKTEADRQGYIEADRNERAMLLSVDDWFHDIVGCGRGARGTGQHRHRVPHRQRLRARAAPPRRQAVPVHALDRGCRSRSARRGRRRGHGRGSRVEPRPRGHDRVARRRRARPCRRTASICRRRCAASRCRSAPGVFLDWVGDAVRAAPGRACGPRGYLYVRNADGTEELYRTDDLLQLHNLAGDVGRRRDCCAAPAALLSGLVRAGARVDSPGCNGRPSPAVRFADRRRRRSPGDGPSWC